MKSAQGEKSKYGMPVITFCHKTWQEPFIASAGGTLLQTNHDLLWRKKKMNHEQELMKYPLLIWGLYFSGLWCSEKISGA